MESKKFLSVDEVIAEFGLDAAALKAFVDAGDVRALADRGTWKYRRDELQALVDAERIAPRSGGLSSGDSDDSNAHILTLGEPADDDLSYIELDEEALAEHATIISKSSPVSSNAPVDEESPAEDWFVPSDEVEMKSPVAATEQSSSDVAIYSGPDADEGEDSAIDEMESTPIASAADSDSDVRLADFSAPRPEDSGIMLDFNLDAGATVSSSGSSLRLPRTAADTMPDGDISESDESSSDVEVWNVTEETPVMGGSSIGTQMGDESGINLANDDDISLEIGAEDSGIQLAGIEESGLRLSAEESGIMLDEGSTIGLPGGDDSGIALDSGASGISIEEDDGITLAQNDSGISLVGADSGLSLEADESGLSLSEDSGISIAGNAKTLADGDLGATVMFDDDDSDKTRTLSTTDELDHDSGLDMELSGATAEILFDDEDSDDVSATVVKKGRKSKPEPGSLSAAFELDEPAEVEDLEISGDLDAGEDDEVGELEAEEEVFDASEETFSGDEVEATEDEDEDYLEPAAKKKSSGPREPAWGAGMVVGLVACSLFLVANVLVVWAGVSTMWNGAEAEGPAASLITSLAGLF